MGASCPALRRAFRLNFYFRVVQVLSSARRSVVVAGSKLKPQFNAPSSGATTLNSFTLYSQSPENVNASLKKQGKREIQLENSDQRLMDEDFAGDGERGPHSRDHHVSREQ